MGESDFTPAQADALTDAFRLVVEQGEHVTSDQFKDGLAEMRAAQRTEIAEVRTEIANLDARLSTLEEPFHERKQRSKRLHGWRKAVRRKFGRLIEGG